MPRPSWPKPWASGSSSPRFAEFALTFRLFGSRSGRKPDADAGRSTRTRRWPVLALAGLIVLAGGLLWSVARSPTSPNLPNPFEPFVSALGPYASVFGAAADLPAEWTLEGGRAPETAAVLKLTAPLGGLDSPFTVPLARKAHEQLREGRFADAAETAEQAWDQYPRAGKPEERALFAFLLASLRTAGGDRQGAIAAARVAASHPALGPSAVKWLAARADDQGLSNVVLSLAKGRQDPGLDLLRARALRRSGQADKGAELLNKIQAPKGSALARRVLAEQMRVAASRGQQAEAVAIARTLMAAKSAQAEEAVDFLVGDRDAVWQQRLTKRPEDAAAVLDALAYSAQRRRYARAIPAFEALAEQPQVAKPVRCHARSWAAKAYDRRGDFDKAWKHYEVLATECDGDAAVRAHAVDDAALGPGQLAYRMGRLLLVQGKDAGVPYLQRALREGLTGLDHEDAKTLLLLAKSADALESLKTHGKVAAQDYAEKDIVDVAAWRVAMDRMVAGKWKDALPVLDRLVAVRDADPAPFQGKTGGPGEGAGEASVSMDLDIRYDDRDWARGRADYFAGRAQQALGRAAEAEQRWRRVINRHPLSYYATLSLARLKAAGVDVAELTARLGQPQTQACGPVGLDQALLDQRVQRARLLGILGWHEEAGDELDAAGFGRDVTGAERWAPGDPGGAWTRAALDDEAGRWTSSHGVGRDLLRRYATAYPSAANRLAWELAYPRAFRTLMDAAAKEFGLHPSIVYAIGRSESGFNPRVESHANAIGLLQLILPTAQEMARPLGLVADAKTLRQPAVNVRLGARYLKRLLDRFEREPQMAAGYNAGGGAVGRWRKQRGDWPMDLFVEAVPFRETRDYAKRVSSAIAVYRNLYDGETLHAFALDQKPVPMADEPPTEPPSRPASVAAPVAKPAESASKSAPPAKVAASPKPHAAARPHRAEVKPAAKPEARASAKPVRPQGRLAKAPARPPAKAAPSKGAGGKTAPVGKKERKSR